MKRLYGATINMAFMMMERMVLFVLAVAVALITVYLVTEIASVRNWAQLAVLVMLPIYMMSTARTAFISKWNYFEQVWSAPPWMTVAARYIIFILLTIIFAVLWFFSPLYDGDWGNLVHTVASGVAAMAIYCPVVYLLRGEKGDLDQVILIGALFGSIFGLGWLSARMGLIPMVIIAGAVLVLSLVLSIAFCYMNRGKTSA